MLFRDMLKKQLKGNLFQNAMYMQKLVMSKYNLVDIIK